MPLLLPRLRHIFLVILLMVVPLSALAKIPPDTWVRMHPAGAGKAQDEPDYRPYCGVVAGGGYIFYWGGGHMTHGGNDIDAYIPADNKWVQLTQEENWKNADSWDNLTKKQKEKLDKARHGGWNVPYLSPRGRPLTAHSYSQMTWWANRRRFCISKSGIWCYDPKKGDADGAWQKVADPIPVSNDAIAPWNLAYDPGLKTLVSFVGLGHIVGYALNDKLGTWQKRARAKGKNGQEWTEVYSVYDPIHKDHIVYGAGRWVRIDMQSGQAEDMAQLADIAGSQPQSFSIVWAPELKKMLLAAKLKGELQLWTYDPEKDVWGRFFLEGEGPSKAHARWDTLARDRKTGRYVFVAAATGAAEQIPETWAFRLSGAE
ncbi:MAG TPA: hypothetical protein VKA48_07875, partial [Gammaproteobacteria bacterium]|nr:hypothetical protein [Gammaproteobacteria bacterium]